jgi:hypothetical protein
MNEDAYLAGMSTAPAWPPFPSNSTLILAGAAIAVTMPTGIPVVRIDVRAVSYYTNYST